MSGSGTAPTCSKHLQTHLSLCLCLSDSLSFSVCLFLCPSVYLSDCLISLSLSVCLSVPLPISSLPHASLSPSPSAPPPSTRLPSLSLPPFPLFPSIPTSFMYDQLAPPLREHFPKGTCRMKLVVQKEWCTWIVFVSLLSHCIFQRPFHLTNTDITVSRVS